MLSLILKYLDGIDIVWFWIFKLVHANIVFLELVQIFPNCRKSRLRATQPDGNSFRNLMCITDINWSELIYLLLVLWMRQYLSVLYITGFWVCFLYIIWVFLVFSSMTCACRKITFQYENFILQEHQ